MAEKTLHFKNSAAYKKWLAFKHMHGKDKGGHNPVKIAGKTHKVNHGKKSK